MNAVNPDVVETKPTPKLAEALAKAQGAFATASKDKTNPHFGSKYADLASIMEACRGPLSENGLSFVQVLNNDDRGVLVVTRLMHVSGESIESPCWLPVAQKTPQGYGSAITYARRYGFATLIGIAAEEDDDGNAASGGGKPPAPNGTSALKSRMAQSEDPGRKREHSDMVMGNFGRAAGKKMSDLSDEDLIFYRTAAKKTLGDPAKEKFHENEKKRLAIFDAELRFRGLPIEDASTEQPKPEAKADAPSLKVVRDRPTKEQLDALVTKLEAASAPYDGQKLVDDPHYFAAKAEELAKYEALSKASPPETKPPPAETKAPAGETKPTEPVLVFGPDDIKGKPISSLTGEQLLQMGALGRSKLGSLKTDAKSTAEQKAAKVNGCLAAIDAELKKRDAALLEEPEPGLDVD